MDTISKSCRGVSLRDISDTNKKLFGFLNAITCKRANQGDERDAYSLKGFG